MGDPDALNSRGLRALQMAIATGHLGMVTLLVERGADVNASASGCDAASVFERHG